MFLLILCIVCTDIIRTITVSYVYRLLLPDFQCSNTHPPSFYYATMHLCVLIMIDVVTKPVISQTQVFNKRNMRKRMSMTMVRFVWCSRATPAVH